MLLQDPETENELEDLKTELEKAIGKDRLQRKISIAKSNRVSLLWVQTSFGSVFLTFQIDEIRDSNFDIFLDRNQ